MFVQLYELKINYYACSYYYDSFTIEPNGEKNKINILKY